MRYRLIAFDLDGTLLNRNKQILPESLSVRFRTWAAE